MALGVPSERRFKELVYAITKHFRAAGVTLNMNMEIADLLGSAQLSGHGVSFAADNVIQLKYVEVDGHLERGDLGAQGARRAARHRRAPAQYRRGPDRGRVGVRGPARGADRPARARRPERKIDDHRSTTLYDVDAAAGVGRWRRRAGAARPRAAPRPGAVRPVRAARGRLGHEPRVVLVPETSLDDRVALTRSAAGSLRPARRPGRAHPRVRGGPRRRAWRCPWSGSTR